MIRTIAVFCLLAAPVAAQDLPFDISHTEGCLAGTSDVAEQEACVGRSADRCILDMADDASTVVMGGCLDRELSYWDVRLNDSYGQVMTRLEAWDKGKEDGIAPEAPYLRDMQRAWIAFRDAKCDFERSRWGGGTGGGPATLACLMSETGRQALYIEASDIDE